MARRKLILVRHSQSQVQPGQPPATWPLSEEGRLRCRKLAQKLRGFEPTKIVTSHERKARETGQLLAQQLGVSSTTSQWLNEQERSNAPFLPSDLFVERIQTLFSEPERLVFGSETGQEALQRFERGVAHALSLQETGNLILVTHGTVLSLFVAKHTDEDAFEFWKKLTQPAFVVFELPTYALAATSFTV